MKLIRTVILGLLALAARLTMARLAAGECEVCIETLTGLSAAIPAAAMATPESIETAIKHYCAETKSSHAKKICYYIGGSEISATSMIKEVSVPLHRGFPIERICEKLKKTNASVCELTKSIDINTVDLNKLRIKELKKLAASLGKPCQGCLEKSDYIKHLASLKKPRARAADL